MKTLLESIIEGFVREYTDSQKQKMGIPFDVVSRGGKWYRGDVYAGKVVNGKFVSAQGKPEDEPDSRDPAAGKQSVAQGTADAEKILGISDVPPEEKSKTELEIKKQRQVDGQQVIETLESTVESLKQKTKERLKLSKQIEQTLKKQLNLSSRWIEGARSSGEQLTMVGINGTEETKSATEWVTEALSLRAKNVGAGTDESRAGESAIVWGLTQLKSGVSLDEIKSKLEEIASRKGSVLKKSWIGPAMKTIESLSERYGIENIQEIAWDTKEGNELVGSTGHGTSADMFIKLLPSKEHPNGKTIGVSLKKDFNVFFMNGGLATTLSSIIDELSPEAQESIIDTVNIDEYFKRRRDIFSKLQIDKKFRKQSIEFVNNCQKNGECGNLADKDIEERLPLLLDALKEKGDLSIDQMKILARVADNVGGEKYIKNLRNLGNEYIVSIFEASQRNQEFRDLLKKRVIDGLHITETLGIGLNGLDEFATSFGGYNLTLENLSDYFLVADEDKQELSDLVASGNKESVERFFMDRLDLSVDEKTGSPLIRFKRSAEKIEGRTQYLSLADAGIRERGLGEAPTFELGVSNELKYIIQYGGNMMTWPEKVQRAFKKIKKTQEATQQQKELKKLVRDVAINRLGDYGN